MTCQKSSVVYSFSLDLETRFFFTVRADQLFESESGMHRCGLVVRVLKMVFGLGDQTLLIYIAARSCVSVD